jgi:protein translocase SecG subunit
LIKGMSNILAIIMCIVAVAIISLVLIQNKGAGLSSAFGGGNEVYLTKRGIEKWVINLTVILIVSFCIIRILAFYL